MNKYGLTVGDKVEVWDDGVDVDLKEIVINEVDDYSFYFGDDRRHFSWENDTHRGWRLPAKPADPDSFPPDWVPKVGDEFEVLSEEGEWRESTLSKVASDGFFHVVTPSGGAQILSLVSLPFLRRVARPLRKAEDAVVPDASEVERLRQQVLDLTVKLGDAEKDNRTLNKDIEECKAVIGLQKGVIDSQTDELSRLKSTDLATRQVVVGDVIVWTQGSEDRKDWIAARVYRVDSDGDLWIRPLGLVGGWCLTRFTRNKPSGWWLTDVPK